MENKKQYLEPEVELIIIDNEISLIMNSYEPPEDPELW
jgi:hypothetical protein